MLAILLPTSKCSSREWVLQAINETTRASVAKSGCIKLAIKATLSLIAALFLIFSFNDVKKCLNMVLY